MSSLLIDKVKMVLSKNRVNFGELSQAAIYASPHNRGRITILIYENRKRIPSYVVKLPRSIAGHQALEKEQKCLQRCIATNEFLKHQIHRFYWNDEDVSFILEPYISGHRIDSFKSINRASQKVLNWLIQLQNASSGPIWNRKNLIMFAQSLIEQIDHYYEISSPVSRLLIELERRIANTCDFKMQATVVHGDLTTANLRINGNKIEVFDWEWIQEYGWPLLDTWFYLFSVSSSCQSSRNYMESGLIIANTLVGSNQFSKHIKKLIADYNSQQNYPINVIKCFVLLTLLNIIVRDHLISEMIIGRSERFFKILSSLGEQSERFWKFLDSF